MAKHTLLTEYNSNTELQDNQEIDAFEHREEFEQLMDEMLFHADAGFEQLLHEIDKDEDMAPVGEMLDI